MISAATTPSAAGHSPLEPILDALDRGRRALLRRAGRLPAVAALRRRRELRLTAVAVVSIAAAFAAAVLATLPLLLWAPLLFGVPHVISDVRYLLVRRAARGPAVASAPVLALLGVCTALSLMGAGPPALAAAWAAVLCAGLAAPARRTARLAFTALVLSAAGLSLWRPAAATVALAQGHNLVALALGAWVVRGKLRGGFVPAAAFAAGALAIASGACDELLRGALPSGAWAGGPPGGSWGVAAATFADLRATVVPSGLDPVRAARCVALFAFAQSVHYGVWLRLVPDAERATARPVSFRRSFHLLEDDLGPAGARLALALSLALPLAAALSAEGARRVYLQLSAFHGFIELAFVACLALARFAPRGAGAGARARIR